LPDDIRNKLGAAIVEIVKQPEMAARFRAIAFEPTGQGVKEFTAHHAAEVKRWVAFYTEIGLRK
jgi:tripartite-type tricarboxylate transporter receptor subunit TctC